jgi:integrase
MDKAQAGVHPVTEKKQAQKAAKLAEEQAPAQTFRAVAKRYVESYAKKHTKPPTWRELQRQLDFDVFPKWGDRPIASIRRHDVIALLDGIADRGDRRSPVQANRTLARLKTLFRWAFDEELITDNPTTRVRKVVKEEARDRVLSDDEVRWFWAGCDVAGWPFGPLFQLLLLTAQRRDEVGGMTWDEIDFDKRLWVIPRERAKNDRAHEVHLSVLAVEILQSLPRLEANRRLAFSTNGANPVSGFSRAKAALDARMEHHAGGPLAGWILHDLRRTAATGMAKLNIAPHVTDRVLGHVSGTIRGVAAVYNRHAYIDERKAAVETWARHVENLVRPAPENVVSLRSAG